MFYVNIVGDKVLANRYGGVLSRCWARAKNCRAIQVRVCDVMLRAKHGISNHLMVEGLQRRHLKRRGQIRGMVFPRRTTFVKRSKSERGTGWLCAASRTICSRAHRYRYTTQENRHHIIVFRPRKSDFHCPFVSVRLTFGRTILLILASPRTVTLRKDVVASAPTSHSGLSSATIAIFYIEM